MKQLVNLHDQLIALGVFFTMWPCLAEMVRRGEMVIHQLDPEERVPAVSFVHEKDAQLAQSLLRGPWLVDLIEESGTQYIRHSQIVLGVEVVLRITVPAEKEAA